MIPISSLCKPSLCPLQIVLMGLIESYRANGGIDDDQGLDRLYPGGDYFDPLGLADDPDSFAELRVRLSNVLASLSRPASFALLPELARWLLCILVKAASALHLLCMFGYPVGYNLCRSRRSRMAGSLWLPC